MPPSRPAQPILTLALLACLFFPIQVSTTTDPCTTSLSSGDSPDACSNNAVGPHTDTEIAHQDDVYQRQLKWLHDLGAPDCARCCDIGVSISGEDTSSKGQRGLFARKDYRKGQVIFTIPWDAVLHVDAQGHHVHASMFRRVVRTEGIHIQKMALALMVLSEQSRNDSFWKAELDTLPGSYTNAPFYTEEDYQLAQGCAIDRAARDLTRLQQREYHRHRVIDLCKKYPHVFRDRRVCDEGMYMWARNAVHTRAFRLLHDQAKGGSHPVLVPFASYINHRGAGQHNTLLSHDGGNADIEVIALTEIKKGAELFLSYRTVEEHDAIEKRKPVTRLDRPRLDLPTFTAAHYGFVDSSVHYQAGKEDTKFPADDITHVFHSVYHDEVYSPRLNFTTFLLSVKMTRDLMQQRIQIFPPQSQLQQAQHEHHSFIARYCLWEYKRMLTQWYLLDQEYHSALKAYCKQSGSGRKTKMIPYRLDDPWLCPRASPSLQHMEDRGQEPRAERGG